jgi:hypothetical protein
MAGETTSLAIASRNLGKKLPNAGLVANPWTQAYLTTELETNDVKEFGYLPEGVTLLGFLYCPDDLDTATALVQKITVGATDVLTGLTGGQTGAKTLQLIAPLLITDKTLVKVTCTTAAGTPAAGNLTLTPLYFS